MATGMGFHVQVTRVIFVKECVSVHIVSSNSAQWFPQAPQQLCGAIKMFDMPFNVCDTITVIGKGKKKTDISDFNVDIAVEFS